MPAVARSSTPPAQAPHLSPRRETLITALAITTLTLIAAGFTLCVLLETGTLHVTPLVPIGCFAGALVVREIGNLIGRA